MITNIAFKFGRGPHTAAESTKLATVTVFVGPNNSGKSKVLSEILHYCSGDEISSTNVILAQLQFSPPSLAEAEETIRRHTLEPEPNQPMQEGEIIYGSQNGPISRVQRDDLLLYMQEVAHDRFRYYYLRFKTLMLDGQSRINLVNAQGAGDLQKPPTTSLQALFLDDAKRKEVRRILYDAFGLYFVIDPTLLGQLRIRMSAREPKDEIEERGFHNAAVSFHGAALPIEDMSDGVKAFAGMVTAIVAGDPSVVLIDEPEAFLHPSLAFQLGKEISQLTSGTQKNVFVSTHSANFVMGCIQSGAAVNIVRLTYRSKVATARVLRSEEILTLMRNPLLRSTGLISGLFYEFVIVTESDTDRAFYQEVNERLLRLTPNFGIPNCLFLNAQNKQTVHTMIRPLRGLGIPAAAIVDVDILKEGGQTWSNFLEGALVPEIERKALALSRAEVKKKFDATTLDMKRDGGIDLLSGEEKESAKNLFERLSEYGLFVVPRGELESWLSTLGASGHGPGWLIEIFGKMGEDPSSSSYVVPTQGDVWKFVAGVKKWFTNPNRKGIPE
jgi:AAA domain, putative AbiEii toxin, Type IV TA system